MFIPMTGPSWTHSRVRMTDFTDKYTRIVFWRSGFLRWVVLNIKLSVWFSLTFVCIHLFVLVVCACSEVIRIGWKKLVTHQNGIQKVWLLRDGLENFVHILLAIPKKHISSRKTCSTSQSELVAFSMFTKRIYFVLDRCLWISSNIRAT